MQKHGKYGYKLKDNQMSLIERPQTNDMELQYIVNTLQEAVNNRITKHGYGIAISIHEIYGILAEEMKELLDDIHANEYESVYEELVDVAVAAIYGMVSMKRIILEKSNDK